MTGASTCKSCGKRSKRVTECPRCGEIHCDGCNEYSGNSREFCQTCYERYDHLFDLFVRRQRGLQESVRQAD